MPIPSRPRDRLLDAAATLFYSKGIATTGVDRVVALANVSKPTLYSQFRSKDELITAVLERRHLERMASLESWVRASSKNPKDRLLAVFDWLDAWHAGEGGRGCAFISVAAEIVNPSHPAREIARRQKDSMRKYLAQLAREANLSLPEQLGADLMLLVDGANARVLVEGDLKAAADARRLAILLIDAQPRACECCD